MKRSKNERRGGKDCPDCGSMMAGPLVPEYTLWVCPKCGHRHTVDKPRRDRKGRLKKLGERLEFARTKDWEDEVAAFASLGDEAVPTLAALLARAEGGHVATEALRRIGTPAAMDALLAGALRLPNWQRIRQFWLLAGVTGLASFLVWAALEAHSLVLVAVGVMAVLSCTSIYSMLVSLHRRTAGALGEFHEPRTAGVLATAYADPKSRKQVTPYLNEVLPKVTEEASSSFTPPQRSAILRLLEESDPALVLGALHAASQFAGGEAVPAVTRALNRQFHPSAWLKAARAGLGDPAAAQASYRETAEQALAAVQSRADRLRDASTLLRAAGPANALPTEQLLRPAAGEPDVETEQLLRRTDEPPETQS